MRKRIKSWAFAFVPLMLALFAGLVVLGLFLVKLLWGWVIPDLFPGAVEQGLVASEISWLTSFKVAIFLAFFGAIAGAGHGHE